MPGGLMIADGSKLKAYRIKEMTEMEEEDRSFSSCPAVVGGKRNGCENYGLGF
jgi:hypothetical protein